MNNNISKCREYISTNLEIGDANLSGFINEFGVFGIETNGDPVWFGEDGFSDCWKTLTPYSELSIGSHHIKENLTFDR